MDLVIASSRPALPAFRSVLATVESALLSRCGYIQGRVALDGNDELPVALNYLADKGPWSSNAALVIDKSNERAMALKRSDLDALASFCIATDLPPSRIIFIAQSRYPNELTSAIRRDVDLPLWELPNFVSYHAYPVHLAESYGPSLPNDFSYSQLYYSLPRFLCLNRLARPHRRALAAGIKYLGLKNVILSEQNVSGSHRDEASLRKIIRQDFGSFLPLVEQFGVSAKTPPVSGSLLIRVGPGSIGIPDEASRSSCLWIVTESEYDHIRLTEKTFKPIAAHRPFVIAGAAGSLVQLRDWGFETFDGIIDETYDTIHSHNERFLTLLAEIERLTRLLADTHERRKFLDAVHSICERNQDHLARGFAPLIKQRAGRHFLAALNRPVIALKSSGPSNSKSHKV